jgi:hypothetical protein
LSALKKEKRVVNTVPEALLFAKYLRGKKKEWIARIGITGKARLSPTNK